MSYFLSTMQDIYRQAGHGLKDLSAKAPGSPLSQTLAVGALVTIVTYSLLKKRYRLPPGPRGLPVLGNLLSIMTKNQPIFITLERWAREKYGPVLTVRFGPMTCISLNNLEVVNEALVKRGSDFAGRAHLYSMEVLTQGYSDIAFGSYSPAWKLHRKIAVQAMKLYLRGKKAEEVVHHCVTIMMEQMAAEPGAFDPSRYTNMIMFHIMDALCFGQFKPFGDPTIQKLADIFKMADTGNGFWEDIIPLLKYWPTKKFKAMCAHYEDIMGYIDENIEEHKKTFNPDNLRDMTDTVLQAQKDAEREESAEVMAMFTDTHVRQTMSDLFEAGVDTSSLTLCWALLFLAGHPEIQKKTQDEVDGLMMGSQQPGLAERPQLQYTEAVLNETLRMGSVAPSAVPHRTIVDTTVAGYEIPKDTMVLVNIWALSHDPQYFEDPYQFKPERFLDEEGKVKKIEGWLPFSAGRRSCLGEGVARAQLLMMISCLMQRFTLSLAEGCAYDPEYNVSSGYAFNPPKPYKIVVTPR